MQLSISILTSIIVSLVGTSQARVSALEGQVLLGIFGKSNPQSEPPTLDQLWGEDWPFSGLSSYAHLPYHKCLVEPDTDFDIGIIGVPFDTATTYRTGARFGPKGIRAASARQTKLRGYNPRAGINPYNDWAKVIDCGDIPVTPMDNNLALRQMTVGFEELLIKRNVTEAGASRTQFPRLVAMGGDHSILLPHLRALKKAYNGDNQEIHVIHFDAHLDTWSPSKYPSFWHSKQSEFTHGSMLWMAAKEGLINANNNVHLGLRTRLNGEEDNDEDEDLGFTRISADDVWIHQSGVNYVVDKILETIPKNKPVYLSVDIDCLDPGFAPGTGTIESGGLLPRELIYILRKLEGLNLVGADVVEVNPAFDHSEVTTTNGAQVVYELVTSMVKRGKLSFLSQNEQTIESKKEEIELTKLGHGGVIVSEASLKQGYKYVDELRSKIEDEIAQLDFLKGELKAKLNMLEA
ncbi:hypothetical protein BABINDRAFT_162847 [Babjeviella inositovora NRRL Y-12698]|uniref:Agmatinase n=1 Tax=Babjeviella inositovora NRRL Y-12698 TaxID=984486 RepID=A0A1E3QKG1_9ASCO|nr:uncharacterized protein BABINDRAFT_162847 [Babjeviella inositovora NRRL Y-12698]ODQ78173.1 hypothetical protein BABINDRAFT_162847 [Babjeviella inositovora NRRL Y-12698]